MSDFQLVLTQVQKDHIKELIGYDDSRDLGADKRFDGTEV